MEFSPSSILQRSFLQLINSRIKKQLKENFIELNFSKWKDDSDFYLEPTVLMDVLGEKTMAAFRSIPAHPIQMEDDSWISLAKRFFRQVLKTLSLTILHILAEHAVQVAYLRRWCKSGRPNLVWQRWLHEVAIQKIWKHIGAQRRNQIFQSNSSYKVNDEGIGGFRELRRQFDGS